MVNHPIIRFNMWLGVISVFLRVAYCLIGNILYPPYDPISNSIGELAKYVKGTYLEKVSTISKTSFLFFEWGFVWFSFKFCDGKMRIASILYLIGSAIQSTCSRSYSHKVKNSQKGAVSKYNVIITIAYAVVMYFALNSMKKGFRKELTLYAKHVLVSYIANAILLFNFVHFFVVLMDFPIYGLSERLYYYTNEFLILVISLHLTNKKIYIDKKLKDQ